MGEFKELKIDKRATGERIAALRKAYGLTQRELAEFLGVTPKHCSFVERGIAMLSLENLMKVSSLFSVTLDYLVTGNPEADVNAEVQKIRIAYTKMAICLEKAAGCCPAHYDVSLKRKKCFYCTGECLGVGNKDYMRELSIECWKEVFTERM